MYYRSQEHREILLCSEMMKAGDGNGLLSLGRSRAGGGWWPLTECLGDVNPLTLLSIQRSGTDDDWLVFN